MGGKWISNLQAQRIVLSKYGGITFLEDYPGMSTKWKILCPNGHECTPRLDNIKAGYWFCKKECKALALKMVSRRRNQSINISKSPNRDKNKRTNEEAQALVLEKIPGVTFLEEYPNCSLPWRMLCANGHECSPRFYNIMLGHHICKECKGTGGGYSKAKRGYFYLVSGEIEGIEVLQYGITNIPNRRLYEHAKRGFTKIILLADMGAGTNAAKAEIEISEYMRSLGLPTAKSIGLKFEGNTEAFVLDSESELVGKVVWAAAKYSKYAIDSDIIMSHKPYVRIEEA